MPCSESIACVKSELSIFDPQVFQTTMERGSWVDCQPIATLGGDGPIEFLVASNSTDYVDVNETALYLKVRIKGPAQADLLAGAEVAFSNMALASLFSDVSLSLGPYQLEGGRGTYPYRAMITALIQNSTNVKKNQLLASGFVKDHAGDHDAVGNTGHVARRAHTARSVSREYFGPLHLDFFQQSKYLISNVDMRVRLMRAPKNFSLMVPIPAADAVPDYTIDIQEAVLYVRKVRVSPSVIAGHAEGLKTQNAIYPIQRCEVISYMASQGSFSWVQGNMFQGQMPKFLLFGQVLNSAFGGNVRQSPFNFQHFNISQIGLYREGESTPFRPFKLNFGAGQFYREYMAMYQALGMYNRDEENDISPADFAGGTALFAFNLAPDLELQGYAQPLREGNLKLELA